MAMAMIRRPTKKLNQGLSVTSRHETSPLRISELNNWGKLEVPWCCKVNQLLVPEPLLPQPVENCRNWSKLSCNKTKLFFLIIFFLDPFHFSCSGTKKSTFWAQVQRRDVLAKVACFCFVLQSVKQQGLYTIFQGGFVSQRPSWLTPLDTWERQVNSRGQSSYCRVRSRHQPLL
jgi:hypothetical protein